MDCVIVDSGAANFASIRFALRRLGVRAAISADPEEIAAADKLVLPGVSASGVVLAGLRRHGLLEVLRAYGKPVLGLCLGLQILGRRSQEGGGRALGILPAEAKKLKIAPSCPIPHMGWNAICVTRSDCPLLTGIPSGAYVYFAHSYAVAQGSYTAATCTYGAQTFSAVAWRNHVYGCQFHPERSGSVGARILRNFVDL